MRSDPVVTFVVVLIVLAIASLFGGMLLDTCMERGNSLLYCMAWSKHPWAW